MITSPAELLLQLELYDFDTTRCVSRRRAAATAAAMYV